MPKKEQQRCLAEAQFLLRLCALPSVCAFHPESPMTLPDSGKLSIAMWARKKTHNRKRHPWHIQTSGPKRAQVHVPPVPGFRKSWAWLHKGLSWTYPRRRFPTYHCLRCSKSQDTLSRQHRLWDRERTNPWRKVLFVARRKEFGSVCCHISTEDLWKTQHIFMYICIGGPHFIQGLWCCHVYSCWIIVWKQ